MLAIVTRPVLYNCNVTAVQRAVWRQLLSRCALPCTIIHNSISSELGAQPLCFPARVALTPKLGQVGASQHRCSISCWHHPSFGDRSCRLCCADSSSLVLCSKRDHQTSSSTFSVHTVYWKASRHVEPGKPQLFPVAAMATEFARTLPPQELIQKGICPIKKEYIVDEGVAQNRKQVETIVSVAAKQKPEGPGDKKSFKQRKKVRSQTSWTILIRKVPFKKAMLQYFCM